MVSSLDSRSNDLGARQFNGEFNAGGNPAMDQHPIQGGVTIFLVFSCYTDRDKLRPWLVTRLVFEAEKTTTAKDVVPLRKISKRVLRRSSRA